MQHHTLSVGTAEFKVAWFPKAHFRSKMYEPTQLKRPSRHMKNKSLCSKWRTPAQAGGVRIYAPCPFVFLRSMLLFLTLCVPALQFLDSLTHTHPSCRFSWRKRKEAHAIRWIRYCFISTCHESLVYRTALPHRYTIFNTTMYSTHSTLKKSLQLFPVLALEELKHKFRKEVSLSLSLHMKLEIGNPSLVFHLQCHERSKYHPNWEQSSTVLCVVR